MLSGGAQHRALPRHQIEEIKILNMLFLRLEIELTICHVSSHTLCPILRLASSLLLTIFYIK